MLVNAREESQYLFKYFWKDKKELKRYELPDALEYLISWWSFNLYRVSQCWVREEFLRKIMLKRHNCLVGGKKMKWKCFTSSSMGQTVWSCFNLEDLFKVLHFRFKISLLALLLFPGSKVFPPFCVCACVCVCVCCVRVFVIQNALVVAKLF